MKQRYVIGIDIGGTNTDAVLVDHEEKILASVKITTTDNISHGFKTALNKLLEKSNILPSEIEGLFVGTTHATNAILQKRDLYKVGLIRIAGHYPDILPAGFSWPQELKETILIGTQTINGGFECHGVTLTPFCAQEALQAIHCLIKQGAESIAIIGVFSPLDRSQEKEVAHLVRENIRDDFPVSCSCEIGGIGFIERENSTILNASLKRVMCQGFQSLKMTALELGISCQIMITQNDGSLISIKRAVEYPVLTISAGPTNSFIGGARLGSKESAVIVDIGGTSTDIGLVRKGFPIRSINTSNIGGVILNFSMPNVLSVALGGGSIVKLDQNKMTIGPQSVAKILLKESLAFGGKQLTLTDVALSLGYLEISEANPNLIAIAKEIGKSIFEKVENQIKQLVFKMQGEFVDLPVILVGGGSALFTSLGHNYQIPPYFDVANAYGAALAEISGTVDTVVSLKNREEVLEEIYELAKQKAIDQGANSNTLRLVDQHIIPYSYVPNQMARILVKFSGKRL